VDAVDLLFPRFINTLLQQSQTVPFLPMGKVSAATAGVNAPKQELPVSTTTDVFDFEPDEETVLGALLPHSLNFQMHQILLETKASEQSARMVAMKNATDNAKQIIKDLTLEYNKLRQANITKELLEITTAQMAVG
jgi:F-type H+-transporting ATPase subunit gamma